MNDVASWLLWSLGRTTLVLAAAALITTFVLRVARPSWPSAQRLAWLVVLLVGWSFIRLPVAVPWYEQQSIEPAAIFELAADEPPVELFEFEPQSEPPLVGAEHAPQTTAALATATAAIASPAVVEPPVIAHGIDWPLVLLGAWAFGAAALVSAWGVGYVIFVRSLAARVPVDEVHQAEWRALLDGAGIRRDIPLRLTQSLGPLLCRLPRGYEIIVPESLWNELNAEQRIAILRHELAHYQRGDVWTSLVARVLALPHWFNPAAWWAARQFDEAAEWACDRAAAGDAATTDYASALVRLGQLGPRATFYGTGVRGRSLAARIRRVLTAPSREDSLMKKALLLTVVFGLAAASVVQIELVAQQPTNEEKKSADVTEPIKTDAPLDDKQPAARPTTSPYLNLLQSKKAPADGPEAAEATKPKASQAAIQKMVDEAHAAYEANHAAYQADSVAMERLYDWSLRWLAAEQAAAMNSNQKIAAIQAHLDRMSELQKRIAMLHAVGARGGEVKDVSAANFYVAEAERLLAEAQTEATHRTTNSVKNAGVAKSPSTSVSDLRIRIAELKDELAQTYSDLQTTNRVYEILSKNKSSKTAASRSTALKASASKLNARLATLTEQLQVYERTLVLMGTPEDRLNRRLRQSDPVLNEGEGTASSDRGSASRREHANPATQEVDLKIAMSEIEKEVRQTEIELNLAKQILERAETQKPGTIATVELARLRAEPKKLEVQLFYLSKRLSLYQEKAKLLDAKAPAVPVARALPEAGDKAVRFKDKDFDSWAEELHNELSPDRRAEAIDALAAFGRHGYGPQAAKLILQSAREYTMQIADADVQAAHFAFMKMPADDVRPAIIQSLESDDANERWFAVVVLPIIAQREETVPLFIKKLKDPSPKVRQAAAEMMVSTEPPAPELVVSLREWLASDDLAQFSIAAGSWATPDQRTGGQSLRVRHQLLVELLPDLAKAIERPEPFGPLVEQPLTRLSKQEATEFLDALHASGLTPGPHLQPLVDKFNKLIQ